jgi:dienelactone hydrolase
VIPVLLVLASVAVLAAWFFSRQAKVRWAKDVALPEAERQLGIEPGFLNLIRAFRLAVTAEKYIPNDPKLAGLLVRCSVKIDINTEPPGARVYINGLSESGGEWQDIGLTPIEDCRVPVGYLKWRMEKEGYETVLAVAATFEHVPTNKPGFVPCPFFRRLDKKQDLPAGMVRVAGAKTDLGQVEDFFIDKFEVTNRQFMEFVGAGGYKDPKYWKLDFFRDGRKLPREEVMAEFVDQTGRAGPSTWRGGNFLLGQENYPVSGVSWYEAAAFAEFAGKSLPTVLHWGIAAGEYTPLLHRWSVFRSYISQKNNFKGEGPEAVGSHDDATAYGAFDMGGNVREWCWNQSKDGRIIRGGAWNDAAYLLSREKIPAQAFEPYLPQTVDFFKETPVPDSVFEVYKSQFSYDKTELNARMESRDERSPDWVLEKISFDAAYGNERLAAYLFLPKDVPPPYQTVIYFPGRTSAEAESSQDLANGGEFKRNLSHLVRNGRSVVFPIYKGTFERKLTGSDAIGFIQMAETRVEQAFQMAEIRIQQVKDFRRSVDYLETRPDIDIKKLAYMGNSWGGRMAPIVLAVEDRLKIGIITIGGLETGWRPEVNGSSYVRRVKIPVLLLSGRYDMAFPYETSSRPLFDLLGTPAEDKVQKVYETDHWVPQNELIKETLAWLDKYLGPVR